MAEIKLPDGAYRIEMPIPFPLKSVHAYVLETAEGFVLVDSGFPSIEARTVIEQELERVCGSPSNVVAVIITHFHPDHSGLAGWLEEIAGCQVYIHERDWLRLEQLLAEEDPSPKVLAPELAAQLSPELSESWRRVRQDVRRLLYPIARPVLVAGDEVLDFGDRSLRLLWTPGHTEGHLCVLDSAERVLYAGDHLLARITPHIGAWYTSGENPLRLYERSLNLIEELAPRFAFPAHEAPLEDPAGRAREILKHHQERRQAVLSAISAQPRSAREISEALFPQRMDGFNQFLALSETIAHLQALSEEGAVRSSSIDGQRLYSK